ncbi:hypothetical protein LSH36_191g04084 [Paralvinella palmiformis]|uniref:Helicase ATP-binding domain-containing protein n=1 Tax=Paralvinella palmiformis TaxID=53620 RepID=A0AAD9N752_9ANNE|nr:hypothetical protein LSH36_191g04084 [Paralvinella palmiformis]
MGQVKFGSTCPTGQVDLKNVPIEIPETFMFPFEPYDIQKGFMEHLYKALELGKIGIFESPTGTGKSLSIICGALRWLKDHVERQQKALEELMSIENLKSEGIKEELKSEPDWIQDFAKKQGIDEKAKQLKEEQEARKKLEEKLKEVRTHKPNNKRKRNVLDEAFEELFKDAPSDLKKQLAAELKEVQSDGQPEDEDIVLDEYFSDEESMRKDGESDDEDLSEVHITKIYYCSRTHSQLSQFVREIQKSPYSNDTPVISLGSRQNMCINEEVKKLNSLSLINDRCLEMQKNKDKKPKGGEAKRKKSSGNCPFNKQDPILRLKDATLAEIGDIEELVKRGKQMKACPYYATRHAIPAAELVALPYNTLLHKATRESCGIKLKGNVVIIDEAHNLIETIGNIYSVEVSGSQLTCAYSQLSQYQDRYRNRLKAKNLMYIKQLLFLLSTFIKCLGGRFSYVSHFIFIFFYPDKYM